MQAAHTPAMCQAVRGLAPATRYMRNRRAAARRWAVVPGSVRDRQQVVEVAVLGALHEGGHLAGV